jgi:hypothetical protein
MFALKLFLSKFNCLVNKLIQYNSISELFDGLLLPSVVGGQTPFLFRAEDVGLEHRDVEEDLEAGHLHF